MSKRLRKQRAERKRIELMRDEEVYVGFDVHKRSYSATMWSERRQAVVAKWSQPAE